MTAERRKMENEKKEKTKKENPKLANIWKLYTDNASTTDGSGEGLMLINPEGKEYMYALCFGFETMNNEAEYKALLSRADALRKLVLMTFEHLTKEVFIEVLEKRLINDKEVSRIEAEKDVDWMTLTYEYLLSGLLPENQKRPGRSKSEPRNTS
ncbi:reverse transcriptase domain-containing protein [Tanacetum coccineum]|uniref:Reverse transcriptase domain-containing protein n=1 Tax=Tanacetum coccineum TaxID=301880 RepID=A0ABQ5GI75_9ASTR